MVANPTIGPSQRGGNISNGSRTVKLGANRGFLQFGWFAFPVRERNFFKKRNAVTLRVKLRGQGYISNVNA